VAWIRTPDPADDAQRALYRRIADPRTGAVDNILAVHALHPAGQAAHVALYEAVMRGTPGLAKVDRELIALVVSALNRCRY
jgi:alkylhydroperoxidase family enzyme